MRFQRVGEYATWAARPSWSLKDPTDGTINYEWTLKRSLKLFFSMKLRVMGNASVPADDNDITWRPTRDARFSSLITFFSE
jgi:hypothetical protein